MISLVSRIGSPAENGARAIEPASCWMASGRSLLRMKFGLATAAGQVCQRSLRTGDGRAQADVGGSDENVDGFHLRDWRQPVAAGPTGLQATLRYHRQRER